MSDDETKQILREILVTQKEYLQRIRQMEETYDSANARHAEAEEKYRSHLREVTVATTIRALALLGVVAILGYIVIWGLHTH